MEDITLIVPLYREEKIMQEREKNNKKEEICSNWWRHHGQKEAENITLIENVHWPKALVLKATTHSLHIAPLVTSEKYLSFVINVLIQKGVVLGKNLYTRLKFQYLFKVCNTWDNHSILR